MGTWHEQEINTSYCEPFGGLFVGAALPNLSCPDQNSIGRASKDITQTQLPKVVSQQNSGFVAAAVSFIYRQLAFLKIAWPVSQ